MQSKQHEFLSLAGVLPARLTCEQTAWRLNFAEHDIPILAAAGILRPLGRPAPNAPKYYALADVEELATNPKLLDKATATIQSHWLKRRQANGQSRNGKVSGSHNGQHSKPDHRRQTSARQKETEAL